MDREAALDAIDALVEKQTTIYIRLVQNNQSDLATELSDSIQAWRTLSLKLGGIEMGELEGYRRHLKQTGEY